MIVTSSSRQFGKQMQPKSRSRSHSSSGFSMSQPPNSESATTAPKTNAMRRLGRTISEVYGEREASGAGRAGGQRLGRNRRAGHHRFDVRGRQNAERDARAKQRAAGDEQRNRDL